MEYQRFTTQLSKVFICIVLAVGQDRELVMPPVNEGEENPSMKNDYINIIIHLELHRALTHFHRKRLSEMSVCLEQQTETRKHTPIIHTPNNIN